MKNEKGVTLMELLASLALVSIIIIGIMSVIQLTFKADESTTNQVNLTNEANLLLSYIENEFFKNKNTNPVFIKEDDILKICSEGTWKSLHEKDIRVDNLKINGNPVEMDTDSKNCTIEESKNKELSIEVTISLTNDPEEKITVGTTFKRY